LHGETHREHAVREHTRQAHRGGHVVAIVNGVEVTGCARVAHERVAAERQLALGDNIADGQSGKSGRAHSSPRTTRVDVAVTTWVPDASATRVSAVTIECPPRL